VKAELSLTRTTHTTNNNNIEHRSSQQQQQQNNHEHSIAIIACWINQQARTSQRNFAATLLLIRVKGATFGCALLWILLTFHSTWSSTLTG
jgi:hypothetical protein